MTSKNLKIIQILKIIRPYQYVKNILVFTPLGGLGPIDIVTLNMTTGE